MGSEQQKSTDRNQSHSLKIEQTEAEVSRYRQLVDALGSWYGRMVSWDEIQPVVEELRSRKILSQLNGSLISLAARKFPHLTCMG
jgi:hypothetical protein